ncbi:hypothetical protein [Niabella hibiscisoli]|uniref:hypothetical protein n=1 Tax=Niabella hibiscisoli TaxID=1825928 RepID=UPI001F0E9E1D|nr:hypothetical protein [Niabella hibiscisoli]MCH5718881.1 hypothetical protein [Niabella hibiscisoli]
MRKKLLIPILMLLFCNTLQAKEKSDTSHLPESYYTTFGSDLPVYSGRLFLGYASSIKGSPYIPETGWLPGDIQYNNIWYKVGGIKFDAYTGELIIYTPNQFSILPVKYRISNFTLGEKKFIRLDSTVKSATRAGFYELLADGDLKVLARRNATLEQKIEQQVLEYEFLRADEFFLQRNDQLTKIVSKRKLYELLKDKKKLIKKTLRPLGLNFKKNKEVLILKAVETYNQN